MTDLAGTASTPLQVSVNAVLGNPTLANPTAGIPTLVPKPRISELRETNRFFAVGRVSTALTGRTASARTKRGTIFSFRLGQPATVTIVIMTSAKCRPSPPGRRPNLRCSRTVATLTRSAHGGLNRLPFSGRIRGGPLNPGAYRAVFGATNAGGSATPQALLFRIVIR
jgi:hypothetical protein